MRHLSTIARSTLFAATAAVLVGGFTVPASARKARPIVVPASALKDETSKLCLPGNVVPNADRNAKTLCQTRSEWTAQGVVIVVK